MPKVTAYKLSKKNKKFLYEAERIKSFESWQCSLISVADLAFNGFFASGDADYATCISCGIQLGNWEICDNIEDEHRNFSPNCDIVKGRFNVKNFPIDALAWKRSRINKRQLFLRKNLVSSKHTTLIHRSCLQHMTAESRLKTFRERNWPLPIDDQMYYTPEELSCAGFIYMGYSNVIKCVSCLGELFDLKKSENINEMHAQLYPECKLIIDRFGFSFVNEVLNRSIEPPIKYLRNNVNVRETFSSDVDCDMKKEYK